MCDAFAPRFPQSFKVDVQKGGARKKNKSESAQPTPTLNDLEEGEGRGHRKETEVKFVARWIDLEVGVAKKAKCRFFVISGPVVGKHWP